MTYLTPQQRGLFTAIRKYVEENGYAPSLRHLAEQFHVSVSTVHRHMGVLEEAGLIRRERYLPRALEILEDATRGGGNGG